MASLRAGAPAAKGAPLNIVGPQVRRLRVARDLSQPQLCAKCQLRGYDLSRVGLSKLEARLRYVTDAEIIMLAEVLGVAYPELFPGPKELAAAVAPFWGGT